MSMRKGRVMKNLWSKAWCRSGPKAFSTLPNYEDFVKRLVKEGITAAQAESLINTLDESIQAKISLDSQKYLLAQEYAKLVQAYQDNLQQFRREALSVEQRNFDTIKNDVEFLAGEISRTKQRITEEAQQLDSGLQLDLSLERKRRNEAMSDLQAKSAQVAEYEQERLREISNELVQVSTHARTAIAGFAVTILSLLVGYKLFVK